MCSDQQCRVKRIFILVGEPKLDALDVYSAPALQLTRLLRWPFIEMDYDYDLGTFTADASRYLHVLGLNGHPLRVDGTDVGVLEQTDKIRLCSLL